MKTALPLAPVLDERTVRQRLLEAATRLFAEKGYAATSVSEIVGEAGVTKPILYYYFKNKEGIYLEIVQEAYGRMDGVLENWKEGQKPAMCRLTGLARQLTELFREKIGVARMIYSIYYGPPQGAPYYDFDAHRLKYMKALRQIVEDGLRAGEFRHGDAEAITLAVAGMIGIAMELELARRGPTLEPGGVERLLQLLFKGIAGEKTSQRKQQR